MMIKFSLLNHRLISIKFADAYFVARSDFEQEKIPMIKIFRLSRHLTLNKFVDEAFAVNAKIV